MKNPIKGLFKVLIGKRGPKAAFGTALAILALAGTVGVGVTIGLGIWPITAATFAASLFLTGVSAALNASGTLGTHKHFAEITQQEQRTLALQERKLKLKQDLFELFGDPQHASQPETAVKTEGKPARGLRSIFNTLKGKQGPKPAGWAYMAAASEAGAVGIGIAVAVCSLPLSAAFFAASLFSGGFGAALTSASSVSNHRHFTQITKMVQQNLALEEENLQLEEELVRRVKEEKQGPFKPAASGPKSG